MVTTTRTTFVVIRTPSGPLSTAEIYMSIDDSEELTV